MDLVQAMTKAKSLDDFNDIFTRKVSIRLAWTCDQVTVEGYEGAVTTDLIAARVFSLHNTETPASKQLAAYLADKVFMPLKKLVESPYHRCSPYQLFALNRIGWTPPPAPEFGRSIALKHAMVLGVLDSKYCHW